MRTNAHFLIKIRSFLWNEISLPFFSIPFPPSFHKDKYEIMHNMLSFLEDIVITKNKNSREWEIYAISGS